MFDDILDQASCRRGKKSWYYKNSQNLVVMYDALVLYDSVYALLKKFFRNHDYYIEMAETFQMVKLSTEIPIQKLTYSSMHSFFSPLQVNMRTNCGQILDATNRSYKELATFGAEFYELTVVNKTAYATFYLPAILALYAVRQCLDLDQLK